MTRDLSGLFSPKSVTVIGASNSPEKVGAIALKNILDSGFRGEVFPVNPKEDKVLGLKCFPTLDSLPDIPDLAVIAVPSVVALEVLEEVGKKGIKNTVIFTAGFKEIGPKGEALQKQLEDIANKYKINILGPNCLGFANNFLPINVTFGQVIKETGNLRIISQSGAIAASLFDWCQTTKLGYGEFITIGNKAVVNENDILKFWSNQKMPEITDLRLSQISPIGLYLESIADGQEFVKIAKEISKTTPIFALKPGKSKAAVAAMHSHTGAIAGEDSVLDEALKEAGIIRCHEMSQFFDVARALAWENAPKGPRVAVVSNAGGPAVLSTDSISDVGLEMAQFSPEAKAKMSAFLPRMASFLNPVDILGDALADRFGQALEAVLQEPTVDAAVVILTPQLMTQIEKTADIIGKLAALSSKPVLCSFIGGSLAHVGEKILNEYKIPSFSFPEMAIKTLSLMWQWQSWRDNESKKVTQEEKIIKIDSENIHSILTSAKYNCQKNLDNFAANEVISSAGISTPRTLAMSDLAHAQHFSESAGWPVVLKISSPNLLHKADVGGVIVGIKNKEELQDAWNILSKKIENLEEQSKKGAKIQIQDQIIGGVEVILGVKRDSNFGPVILFGAGGKFAEIILDRNLHLLPVQEAEAKELVQKSKIFKLLNGFRGDLPYNLDKLYETIIRLGILAESMLDIAEIEINPLIITHKSVWAVDSKLVLSDDIARI